MSEQDRVIGQAVAILRGDMTQQAVADAMRERGWKWSQATVWSVEKGERPLRLAEAQDLAPVLKTHLSALTWQPKEVQLQAWMGEASRLWNEISRLTVEYLKATDQIRYAIEDAKEAGLHLSDVFAAGGGWLTADSPEEAVRQGKLKHAQEHRNDVEADQWLNATLDRDDEPPSKAPNQDVNGG